MRHFILGHIDSGMKRILHLIGILTVVAPLAQNVWAGEFAVLQSGLRLHADRHEMDGARLRLFSNGGVTELPAAAVVRFEEDETPVFSPIAAPGPPDKARL